MKKYKRKIPLISPVKIAIAALYAIIAIVFVIIFCGIENEWIIICSGIFAALVIVYLFIIIAVGHRYAYLDNYIALSYLSLVYRKIKYTEFNSIVISNASYNNGYGYGINGNIPMRYSDEENKSEKKTYPFITLHKDIYTIQKIKAKMSSREIFFLNNDIFCLGICWFDSLSELLNNTNSSVYVLEDVYLRFRGKFDTIFMQHDNEIDRFYIITDNNINYKEYLEGKNE